MGLNKEQQSAVEYIEGPLLVLAGPGTGKTQLLSAKVAYILEHTDTNPENILCLTFTESGASNMRDRLGTMVGQAAAKVNIHTYHAFGTSILERYKNYAENLDRNFDSTADDIIKHKIFRQIREKLPATDILKTADINDLIDTISKTKSARLSSDDLRAIAERNLEDSSNLSLEISPLLEKLVPRMKFAAALEQVYLPILTVLAKFSSPEPIVGSIEPIANILARELKELIDEAEAKEKPSVSPLTAWKNRRFERTDDNQFRLKDYIANKKLLSLSHVMSRYDETLHAEGWYDFDDMIEEAIRALKHDRGFRLSLSETFQYILLDEFQDTNPSQFEIIKLLTDYESPVVMAVGDDDQAIFEFQGASASNLLDFQNYYQAKIVTLLDNYRSTSEILDFSHRVAEQVDESFSKKHQVAKILRSMRDLTKQTAEGQGDKSASSTKQLQTSGSSQKSVESTASQIERHEFLTADDEYAWIAGQITDLIKSGESPSDIAVIAPKHKYIAPLLPHLKTHDINIAYEKKTNILEDEKIHGLIVLAEFVQGLASGQRVEHRLLELLALPCFELDPLAVILAVEKAHTSTNALEYLQKGDDAKLSQLAQWLAALVQASFTVPLELWLDYATGARPFGGFTSPYLKFHAAGVSPSAELEFYENLGALRNATSKHFQNTQPKLADFVAMLADYAAAGASISSTSSYQDDSDCVQIMSSHKSKGLEFKHVFMLAVDEMAWGKAKGNNTTFTLPCNLLQIRHTGITDDERLRLLFVAITRARDHLIMTNSVTDFDGRTVARLSYLSELRDEKNSQPDSPYLPIEAQTIHVHEQLATPDHLTNVKYHWLSNYQTLSPNLKLILKKRLENYRLTASDLTSFVDIIFAGPEEIYRRKILRAPDEPLTDSIAYGNLIHATFEQITSHGLDDTQAIEFYQTEAQKMPLPEQEIRDLVDKGKYGLEIALQQFGALLRHSGARAEVNLHPEHPSFDNIPITGKIDHLEIDDQAKTIEIYDFKTGKYHDAKWESRPNLYKYRQQLIFYKLLLNNSPSFQKYRITRGHILFVSPDQEGKVYDKVYEYDAADEQELRTLAKAVYHQIKSLDFLDNPEINIPADKSRTLKDVKAFIEKLIATSNPSS